MAAETAAVEAEVGLEDSHMSLLLESREGKRLVSAIAKVLSQLVSGLGGQNSNKGGQSEGDSSMQLALLARLMTHFGCDDKFFVPVEQVRAVLGRMGIPSEREDLAEIYAESTVQKHGKIGIRRLLRFVKSNQQRLCNTYRIERLRLLSEQLLTAVFLDDAKIMYRENTLLLKRRTVTAEYRAETYKEPLYACHVCKRRFVSQKLLAKHLTKPKEHRRVRLQSQIWSSQHRIILKAKTTLTGTTFPSYYILNPMIRFHNDLTPQIFDSIGE